MIDYTYLLLDFAKNVVSGLFTFVFGMYVFNRFLLPKISAKMAVNTGKAVMADPEVQSYLQKGKATLDELKNFVDKLKQIDLVQLNTDVRPLVNALKNIDPDTINDMLTRFGRLTDQLGSKPKIPPPRARPTDAGEAANPPQLL